MRTYYDPSSAVQLNSDLEWMLQSGQVDDRTLLITLLQEHFARIDRLFRTAFDDRDTATEGVKDTFATAVTQRHQYREEIGVQNWLFSLAYQSCQKITHQNRFSIWLTQLKSRSKVSKKVNNAASQSSPWLASFKRLTAEERMLITMAYIEEIAHADLSTATGQTSEQASSQLMISINRLGTFAFAIAGYPSRKDNNLQHKDFKNQLVEMLKNEYPIQTFSTEDIRELTYLLESNLGTKHQRSRLEISFREAGLIAIAIFVAVSVWLISTIADDTNPRPGFLSWMNSPTPTAKSTMIPTRTQTISPTAAFQTEYPVTDHADLNFSKLRAPTILLSDGTGLSSSGPAAISLALQAWGWQGDPDHPAEVLLAHPGDQAVMPEEMIAYVEDRTGLKALMRLDGDVQLVCQLADAGFPVIVQRGLTMQEITLTPIQAVIDGEKISQQSIDTSANSPQEWLASYEILSGCNHRMYIWRPSPAGMTGYTLDGLTFDRGWWAFANRFIVVYAPDSEDDLMFILSGSDNRYARDYSDYMTNLVNAAGTTSYRTYSDSNLLDTFYTYYDRGTIFTLLEQYAWAYETYKFGYEYYDQLAEEARPWRMLWYNPNLYKAYYYQKHYQHVIDLATETLASPGGDQLEESYYWRALARQALGDTVGALEDMQTAIELNPFYSHGLQELRQIPKSTSEP